MFFSVALSFSSIVPPQVYKMTFPLTEYPCNFRNRTDIEQEVNGVYSYDRKAKIDPARLKAVFDKGAEIYLGGLQSKI